VSLADPVSYSVRRRYLDRDLELERSLLTGRVLEIGCGRTGRRGLFKPQTEGVTQWVLVDRDVTRAPHVCADACRLPIRTASFDTVVCLEVLEYLWKPTDALAEMRRLLKPGGTLLLSTPFMHRTDAPDDYWRFTEPALRRILMETGFDVVRCVPQGSALAVAANILRYTVSVQRRWIARSLSVLLRPLFGSLLSMDSATARNAPALATFATGYLVVARSAAPIPK